MNPVFKEKKPFAQLLVLVGLMLLGFALSAIVLAAMTLSGADAQDLNTMTWTTAVSQVLTFAMPALLWVLLYVGDFRNGLQLDFALSKWGKAGVGVLLLILLLPALDWVTEWNKGWHLPESMAVLEQQLRDANEASEQLVKHILARPGTGAFVVNLFVAALLPAVCEELFFRCGIQQLLQKCFKNNAHVAILLTAVIFSLAHGEMFAFVPRFIMGLMLGYLFYLSKSVLVNMLVHFCNNAVIVVLYFLYNNGTIGIDPSEPLLMPWLLTTLCAMAALLLFCDTFVFAKRER